jgi:PPOX class probable F420-dependent enzyme
MSRRDQIKMTPEEIDAFLIEQKTMSVATIMPSGRPHVVAMWFTVFDGLPTFWTFAKSQKVVNLRRDPRITVMVEAGDIYAELRGVEIVGTAKIVEDPDEVVRFGVLETEKYQGVKVTDAMLPGVQGMANKRVLVQIVAEKYVSWDHRKLGGAY